MTMAMVMIPRSRVLRADVSAILAAVVFCDGSTNDGESRCAGDDIARALVSGLNLRRANAAHSDRGSDDESDKFT